MEPCARAIGVEPCVGATRPNVIVDGIMFDQSNQEKKNWDVPKQQNF
jgi:hypothetical protein